MRTADVDPDRLAFLNAQGLDPSLTGSTDEALAKDFQALLDEHPLVERSATAEAEQRLIRTRAEYDRTRAEYDKLLAEAEAMYTPKRLVLAVAARLKAISVTIHIASLRVASTSPPARAPSAGWTILAVVCSPEDLERTAGDLEERFPRYVRERGKTAAQIWFWANITRKVADRVWTWVERGLKVSEFFSKMSSGS
jgi:hypothetical protein